MNSLDDDVLQPSLAPDLDIRGYRPLFRPQSILWPTFFGGPVAGGILFGMNYARMNRRDLALRCWIGAAVIVLALGVAIGWYLTAPAGQGAGSGTTRIVRYLVAGISVGIGWFIAKDQEPRFAAWENASRTPARLIVPGFLAWLVGASVLLATIVTTLVLRGGFERA